MTLSLRPLWLWMGLFLIVVATVGGVTVVFLRYSSSEELVETLITVVTTGASAAAGLWKLATRPERALPPHRAADELAEQLWRDWEQAATEQGLGRPAPTFLRWQWSPRQVTGPKAEAVAGPFAPLPGMEPVTAEDLDSGAVRDFHRLYAGLGSGRIIILGPGGAGKTGAGIRLLLDALTHRSAAPVTDRARVPVPILLTPRGWNPTTEPFAEWLATTLMRDYPLLRAPEYGTDIATRLIGGGHLAVILDGFDELPVALRPVALRALDEQTNFRLILLARTQELMDAVSIGGHLRGAAALELLPIDADQAARYLASIQTDPPPAPWQEVIDHLGQHPEGALAQALTTPVMLALLRDTYRTGDAVDELLDTGRFPTREAVEDHLLDRVLSAAYTQHPGRAVPPYTADQARRWLGQLASRMNQDHTRDLAWWRISRWAPAWTRAVSTVAIMSVVAALLVGSLAEPIAHLHLLSAAGIGSSTALLIIFGKTLGYVFLYGLGLLLASPPGAGFAGQPDRLRWNRADIRLILLLAAGVGVVSGFENGRILGLRYGLAIGLMSGVVVGLGFVLGGGPPQRLGRLCWSSTDTRTNLRTGLVIGPLSGLVAGLAYGFGYGKLQDGLQYGFVIGITYLLVIVFGGRRSAHHGQLRGNRTTSAATLLLGLVITIVSTAGYGIVYIVVVTLSGQSPLQQSRLRWSRTTTPVTLLTGLVAGPVLWLWYWSLNGFHSGSNVGLSLGLGIVAGIIFGLLFGLRPSGEATSTLDPQSLWQRDRRSGLVVGLVYGLVVGLVYGLTDGLTSGPSDGLVYGLTAGLVVGIGSALVSSASWATMLTGAQLQRRGQAPARLLPFLDDARQRQILRTVGPVYQFRNARLQNRLPRAENTPQRAPVNPGYATPRC